MSWKVCEPAYRREWRCITSASGSTSNSVVLAWPLPTCWDGDLKTHTKRLSRDALLLGEIDDGLLGGLCNLRVGATSTIQRVVAVHPILGVDRIVPAAA